MVNRSYILALALVLGILASSVFVSAIDTEINVKTYPNYKVTITVLKAADDFELLKSFILNVPADGKVKAVYSGDQSSIKVNVKVSLNDSNSELLLERFGEFPTGSPLYLQVIPGYISNDYKALEDEIAATLAANANSAAAAPNVDTNLVANNSNEVINQTNNSNIVPLASKTSGLAVSNNLKGALGKQFYFVLVGIVVALAVVLVVAKHKSTPGGIQTMLSRDPALKYKPISKGDLTQELAEAEEKLKEAEEEIEVIRGKRKLEETNKKLESDQKELERLRRQEGVQQSGLDL